MSTTTIDAVHVVDGDINAAILESIRAAGRVAWDIETTGLDWAKDRIATVQLAWSDSDPVLVRVQYDRVPDRLLDLLADGSVLKVLHHAMFDLRFMAHAWGAQICNVACTKIASKILAGGVPRNHSLAALIAEHFDVILEKDSRLTDWTATTLTEAQVRYAANDVKYLVPLLAQLTVELTSAGTRDLCEACFAHLPTRVALDLGGLGDVYEY